ncbi:sensor histidine kinase [Chryseobacterium sp. KACC 21268]|nr:sensor histidine kinase [Chryseobacterium sp. KACC 21268]
MDNENLHFKTNIQIKSIIGKDLINDDNIAILELVKNSFDADAKKVTISFLNILNNDDEYSTELSNMASKIIIRDDGVGMDFLDIQNKWLNIAYSEKKENAYQFNRTMAGAKGVGRFSCDRLGEYLNVYTKTKKENHFLKLQIDWKLFEVNDINKEIGEIKLKYFYLSISELKQSGIKPFDHGVVLEIVKLRSKWVRPNIDREGNFIGWNTDKLTNIKKYLEKLINPNHAFEKNDFGIYISAPEFERENSLEEPHKKFIGKVENTIFEKLDFQSTSVESTLNGDEICTELKDKGEIIFRIREKNEFFPLIKNAKITLYYLNPYAKAFFTKQTGIRAVDYGSIFLFINGFRIPPYGEYGNDWLGIDQRKNQGYARFIGLREYVGRIEITDSENDFQIVSSREGIVRNDSFNSLTLREDNKSFFFKTLRRLERYVVDGLNWDSIPKEDKDSISLIERKIISGELTDEELEYREDIKTKKRRVYESIHSIMGAKPETVIEIFINQDLILDKIEEEKEQSEREFIKILEDFEKHKIDTDTLNRIIQRKADKNNEIDKEIFNLTKYNTDAVTSKAIIALQIHRDKLREQESIISNLKIDLENLQKKDRESKQKVEEANKELEETRSQNLFLKSIKSQEFDDVLNLMHHIGISTGTIQNYIKGVIFKIDNNLEIPNSELKNVFSKLNYELNKIYSISKFATKANFKIEAKDSNLDLVSFIEQYLINVVKPFMSNIIEFEISAGELSAFNTTFKPIEMTIILDNLINNSKKAVTARLGEKENGYKPKIEVLLINKNVDQFQINVRDNGIGIKSENYKRIFDYGFTTTNGSGLGLTHIQELLEKIDASILLNENFQNGAEFIIIFNKR